MNRRFFVGDEPTDDGKYRVLQGDAEAHFGVKDFDTKDEAQSAADDMQSAFDSASSEKITGDLPNISLPGEEHENRFKNTLQDLKDETSQE